MEIAPFDNREGFIWMNGEFIKWNDAKCHVITQGLHYASAVFEGERAYKGKIFKSEEHTKRLFRSAEIVGIKIPYSQSQINEAKDELIKKMNFEYFFQNNMKKNKFLYNVDQKYEQALVLRVFFSQKLLNSLHKI